MAPEARTNCRDVFVQEHSVVQVQWPEVAHLSLQRIWPGNCEAIRKGKAVGTTVFDRYAGEAVVGSHLGEKILYIMFAQA